MSIRVDLHTHSIGSPDGRTTTEQYKALLENGTIHMIAITDHTDVEYALKVHESLGDAIIVGQEIMTSEGEVIGLYLSEAIPSGHSLFDTIQMIRDQNGIVYLPHPFETVRHGVSRVSLVEDVLDDIDIIETSNGRTLQNMTVSAQEFAQTHHIPAAASSDAHSARGIGCTYTNVTELPTRDTLITLLGSATLTHNKPPITTYLDPKLNRIRKKLGILGK